MCSGCSVSAVLRRTAYSEVTTCATIDPFARPWLHWRYQWYPNMSRNWQRSAALDHMVRGPSLMMMAEKDLEKYLVKDSVHWTQQERPEEVSAKLIEWRRRRFG
jgi:pimeloyl-ACP methyl ester carboxylesterase